MNERRIQASLKAPLCPLGRPGEVSWGPTTLTVELLMFFLCGLCSPSVGVETATPFVWIMGHAASLPTSPAYQMIKFK